MSGRHVTDILLASMVEYAYRPALQRLIAGFDDVLAVNDTKRNEYGAPDFAFLKKSNSKLSLATPRQKAPP